MVELKLQLCFLMFDEEGTLLDDGLRLSLDVVDCGHWEQAVHHESSEIHSQEAQSSYQHSNGVYCGKNQLCV